MKPGTYMYIMYYMYVYNMYKVHIHALHKWVVLLEQMHSNTILAAKIPVPVWVSATGKGQLPWLPYSSGKCKLLSALDND